MDRIFVFIFNFFAKHKKLYWFTLIGVTSILIFFASKIKLEEDITQMLPVDEKTENSNQILNNTQFLDKLIITISQTDTNSKTDPDALVAFADAFVDSLNQVSVKVHFKDIQAQIDEESIFKIQQIIYKNLPFFIDYGDYATIDKLIADKQVDSSMQNNYKMLASPASIMLKQSIMHDPVGITHLALAKFKSLQPDNQYELYDGYIFSKGQKNIFIFLTSAYPPNETAGNTILIKALNNQIKQFSEKEPAIRVSYFGTPAIAVANASQIKNDIAFTLSIALIFILLIIWFYFRNLWVLPIILLPALFGGIFALAAVYLIKASISVIALGAGTVVLGVAIDYSLHILVHFKHTGSMKTVVKDVSGATLIGCITTVGAFFSLLFVKAELLQDFGLFAGFTLMGAALFSLIFLPQVIKIPFSKQEDKDFATTAIFQTIKNKWPINRYSKLWVIIIFILTGIFLYFSQYAGFESDMSKLNYMSPELKAAEIQLSAITNGSQKPIYLIFSGKNADEALENSEKTIAKIRSSTQLKDEIEFAGVSDILVSQKIQKERLRLWNEYWTSDKKQALKIKVNREAQKLGFRPNSFADFDHLIDTKFEKIDSEDLNILKKQFLKDYINESNQLTTLLATVKTTEKNKAPLLQILEKEEHVVIVDKQNLTAGFIEIINAELNTLLTLSSLLVFVILLISYGRFELAIFTFIPMLVTWIWILGIMGILGIKFNIINIIISTFIFGLGDDYSIFISDGLLNEYKTGKKHLSSFTASILLSAITTIIGVGALQFATHPAIKSIALISVIGILSTVLVSYAVLPFLFKFMLLDRKKKSLPPITFIALFHSFNSYFLFLLGCIFLNITGFVLFTVLRMNKPKSKLLYHYVLMYFARIIAFTMIRVKDHYKILNNENFSTPAIIICNHQSFLDIIVMLTIHPKIIFITNNWVWNSPFFGSVVRYADFQSTSENLEESFQKLSQKIKEGYSILIFPESTRSVNGEIGRFHKGAFYLSEKLNVDILPIMIHGTSDVINKSDELLVKSGSISMKFLPRIASTNQNYGMGYAERSKKIKKYFENEYAELKSRTETPAYFSKKLLYNYIYKGPIVEWYSRIKVKMEGEYALVQSFVPLKATIVDIGCGYGFLAYLLSYKSKDRTILGIDYDADKIEIAQNGYSKSDKVNFIHSDVLTHDFEKTDVFILMDVLHYLEENYQKELIVKCMQNLSNEGIIIIRDSDISRKKQHKSVAASEFFATSVGFNKSVENKLHFISAQLISSIVNEFGASVEHIHFGEITSNTIYIIKLNHG